LPKKAIHPIPDRHLLTRLVCPQTGGPLSISKSGDELISPSAKLAFPIRDGIPIMIVAEARILSDSEAKS